jgi:hypothetical protein
MPLGLPYQRYSIDDRAGRWRETSAGTVANTGTYAYTETHPGSTNSTSPPVQHWCVALPGKRTEFRRAGGNTPSYDTLGDPGATTTSSGGHIGHCNHSP